MPPGTFSTGISPLHEGWGEFLLIHGNLDLQLEVELDQPQEHEL